MVNWYEAEEYLAVRLAEVNRYLTRIEVELIDALETEHRSLRARLAAALIRLGAKLDPHASAREAAAADSMVEGRMAAYLR